MRIAIIGRTEILYNTALLLAESGHDIVCVVTSKEAPEYTRTVKDFRALATQFSAPFSVSANILSQSDLLKEARADIAVSINYSNIIPEAITTLFPLGVLNAHGGDLPRYRGNACQAWAIMNGEPKVGLCVHKMIPGELDNGDIVTRDYMSIQHDTKITSVWNWMVERTPHLMMEAVNTLEKDPNFILVRQSMDPRDALRCYPRRPEDGRINWASPATLVLRLINASNKPYLGAFCEFEGVKLTIWDAEIVEDGELFCAVPGQVTSIGEHSVDIACGEGKIRLKEVEFEGWCGAPSNLIRSVRMRLS
ncbi:methionyl-tRNA formyltransferase [Hoeflea sp.]|uniref:methionyl-tRNA formyltransferase n=1 Tax=Hoeflea sp. TaxID=1940281 RepID=UPI003A8C9FEE